MKLNGFVLSGVLFGVALAQTAGFVVRPSGQQETDLATGVTTLPQGGTVEDAKHGFAVEGRRIELKQGEFLRAIGATIRTQSTGTIRADELDYRVALDRLTATGSLQYSSGDVKGLEAARAVAYLGPGRLVATGGVKAASPALAADALVLDLEKKEAFLYGNYRFEKLSSKKADASLLLSFAKGASKATVVSPVPAAARTAYLDLIERSRR